MNTRNLLSSRRQAANDRRRGLRRWAWINGVYAAALAVAAIVYAQGATTAEPITVPAVSQAEFSRLNSTLTSLRQQAATLREQRQLIDSVSHRPDWTILLDRLAASVGDKIVLTEVSQQIVEGKRSVRIAGRARTPADAAALALQIERWRLFEHVTLQQTTQLLSQSTTVTNFGLLCTLPVMNGGAK